MSGKSKFQISRLLDERIKNIIAGTSEYCDLELTRTPSAYILGFNYANVTNFVGLTTNYQLHHAGFPVVGLVFFKSSPTDDDIKYSLGSIKEYSNSPDGLGSFKSDKNEHLFLIYSVDNGQVLKKIFDLSIGIFIKEQPKLSVLDEVKIYNHSVMVKLSLPCKLDIYEKSNLLLSKDMMKAVLDKTRKSFAKDTTSVQIRLAKSSFSINSGIENRDPTETLFDFLDPPSDIDQRIDYLPQISIDDKKKLVDKWRNKMKTQRAPLWLEITHKDLSFGKSDWLSPESDRLHLEAFFYLHVHDSISKSIQIILFLLRQKIDFLQFILIDSHTGSSIEPNEFKSCTFKPPQVSHLVPSIYPIPSSTIPDYKCLAEIRRKLHFVYLLPFNRPLFRYSQRILDLTSKNMDEQAGYLCNVHTSILNNSGIKGGSCNVIRDTYTYHHYMQDRTSDDGWGCAYRSLQTIISWFKHQGYIYSPDVELRAIKVTSTEEDKTDSLRKKLNQESRVPTHEEIQSVLVDVGDKQPSFIGSQKWIGSQEVCYVLNHLYNLDSKFISVNSGSELVYKARELGQHFAGQSTPVMIGGGVLAHTIIGIDFNEKNGDISYLILDPHYKGAEDLAIITKKGWCGWKKNTFWEKSAFYNLCLPQRPIEF